MGTPSRLLIGSVEDDRETCPAHQAATFACRLHAQIGFDIFNRRSCGTAWNAARTPGVVLRAAGTGARRNSTRKIRSRCLRLPAALALQQPCGESHKGIWPHSRCATWNIFDIVASIRDHTRNELSHSPMVAIGPEHAKLPDSALEELIAELAIPWFINFYVSWQNVDCLRLDYEWLRSSSRR